MYDSCTKVTGDADWLVLSAICAGPFWVPMAGFCPEGACGDAASGPCVFWPEPPVVPAADAEAADEACGEAASGPCAFWEESPTVPPDDVEAADEACELDEAGEPDEAAEEAAEENVEVVEPDAAAPELVAP